MKYYFTRNSAILSAFTPFLFLINAMIMIGMQKLLENFGIKCHIAYSWIITSSSICAFLFPIAFYIYAIKNFERSKKLTLFTYIFNFLEILFIEIALEGFFSSPEILCYGNGGQNGMETILGAAIGAAITFILGLIIDLFR